MMKEQEKQYSVALKIAIDAGVLIRCVHHGDAVFKSDADIQQAYVLGNERFSKGELVAAFGFRKEMTDAIKDTVGAHQAEACPDCTETQNKP